jgi:hypothetical protein
VQQALVGPHPGHKPQVPVVGVDERLAVPDLADRQTPRAVRVVPFA